MIPFQKIVAPTDFSEPSQRALDVAVELARHFSCELVLVHVVGSVPVIPTPASTTFNVPMYQQEIVNDAKATLDRLVEEKVPKPIRVRPMIIQGEAADEIVHAAENEKADIIVIATHGRTGLDRLMFGSVAEKVVRLSPCPVLTIPAHPEGK
jgi:nucleotide-binding universal stress UspA family protein